MTAAAKSQSPWILVISLVIILSLIITYFVYDPFHQWMNTAYEVLTSDDEQRIQEWVKEYGAWGPILIIIAMVAQMFLIVIPSVLLMIIAILAYGSFWGTVISVGAVAIASTIGYLIGLGAGSTTMDKLLGEKNRKWVRKQIDDYGFWAVAVTRFSPFLSNDVISFVGGFVGMNYLKFIAATLAGITPLAISLALFNDKADSIKSVFIWISVISLLGLGLKVFLDKRKSSSKG